MDMALEAGDIVVRGMALADDTGMPTLLDWPGSVGAASPDAIHLAVAQGGKPLATVTLLLPTHPAVADATGLSQADLAASAFIGRIAADPAAGPRAMAWALYMAGREARIRGLTTLAAFADALPDASRQILSFRPVLGVPGLSARDLPYAMTRYGEAIGTHGGGLTPAVFSDEVVRALNLFFERIWKTATFRATFEQRLSREQYVYTLGNLHQFVRYTTRLIGRCVAHSHDSFLRAHFAKHLRGEVNHELIIEQDLNQLGEDVDYVVRKMAPNGPTRRFMASQESAIGFHQGPIMLLAAPLAAEGIAGNLGEGLMDALHKNVARWGVPEPTRVTRFYASHIEFDGGEDGHFAETVKVLERYLTDETRLQLFLSFLSAATEALVASYESWHSDLRLFSAQRR